MDWIKDIPGVKSVTNQDQRGAIITYPTDTSGAPFPLLVFGHGALVGGHEAIGDGYHSLLLTVASYGFTVIAPLGCVSGDFTHDMLATADACLNNKTLHPSLAHADFTRMGFFGHSNGGCATQELAGSSENVAKYNIKAAVSQHCGCPCQTGACRDYGSKGSNIPFMYVSAAGDTIAPPAGSTNGYNLAGDGDKVLWMCKGGSHFEPADRTIPENPSCTGGANREDNPLSLFFACHVRGEHCDEVYGSSGEAICHNNGTVMSQCEVSRGGSPTPPGPTPPGPTPSQL